MTAGSRQEARRGVVFQCAACRALVSAGAIAVDVSAGQGNERAGLACDACGATTWLPFADRAAGARVVDVDVGATNPSAPLALAASNAPSTAMVPVAGAAIATVGARFSDEQRGRIEARIAKLGPATDLQRDLSTTFERLLGQWGNEAEHKQFLKKASMVGELAFAGQRYRAVLEEAPADPQAKTAQNDILGLAMASMSHVKDMGGVAGNDGSEGKKKAAAVVILLVGILLCIGIVVFLPRLLSGALGDATQGEPPPDTEAGTGEDGQNVAVPGPGR